jgi:hypothetical protein
MPFAIRVVLAELIGTALLLLAVAGGDAMTESTA